MTDFSFFDLFAGIGGFRQGFESIGGRCVFSCERDRFARQTYQANFGDGHIAGDVNELALDDIPAHDVLLAGFPCQPFSLAAVSYKNHYGQKHGFACERQGNLFFRIVDILRSHAPGVFVLENVKHLKSHSRGQVWKVIVGELENAGYAVHHRLIDARSFVPQHRERVFIVGFRRDVPFNFDDMPLPAGAPTLGSILQDNESAREYTLPDGVWRYLQRHKEKHARNGNGFGFTMCGPDDVARTLTHRYYKDGSEILIRQEGMNPRRLTPRECARLMGYDDGFVIPVSKTQAYRQFGNSVVVTVVKAVAKHLEPYIQEFKSGWHA